MSKKPTNYPNSHQFADLKTILLKYFYHWPLFLLGLIIAFGVAYEYLKQVNYVYEINSTILVKDKKKSPEDKSALEELDQSGSPKNAESEIEILRSKKLIAQVVNKFQLWATYKTEKDFKTSDIYETKPFNFIIIKKLGALDGQQIQILIKNENTFEVINSNGHYLSTSFNNTLKNDFGIWELTPTTFLNQYIGSVITITLNDPEKVENEYVKTLDVHLLDKLAPTIGLSVDDEVPQRGKDFLNYLIKDYNAAAAEEEKRITKATIDFIDDRLVSLTGELNNSEKAVENYRSSQGLTDINSQSKVYLENVQTNDIKLNEVNVQLNIIDAIEKYVNSSSTNANPPPTIGINDPYLKSLIEKLSQLQLKRGALLATTPETNPEFDPINKQISLTKAAIKENISGIKSLLLNTKNELQSFNNKFESSIKDIPGQERQFIDMKRQQTVKENLYTYLLQKREELGLSYASTLADARIVDDANVGDIKWPRKPFVFAIALFCGLGFPFLIIYFRNSFANKITEKWEIEDALNIPILGEISFENLNTNRLNILAIDDSHQLMSEQFRSLRSNLHYLYQNKDNLENANLNKSSLKHIYNKGNILNAEAEGRVTMFTSSTSKEGKSFLSSNLASFIAVLGRRTVLIEMDLRRPKISKIFGLKSQHPGLSDYLLFDKKIEDILQQSKIIKRLDIIGSGKFCPNPAELLENHKLNDLISYLRTKYDDIIIDTPPFHLVTDAMIIAKYADISLYVIRQGYTQKAELDFINKVHEDHKFPNMNIIFNGIKKNQFGYGYDYDQSYYKSVKRKRHFSLKQILSRF